MVKSMGDEREESDTPDPGLILNRTEDGKSGIEAEIADMLAGVTE